MDDWSPTPNAPWRLHGRAAGGGIEWWFLREAELTMKGSTGAIVTTLLLAVAGGLPGQQVPEWRDLFNGKDLTGWVSINVQPDTFKVENGMIVCSGKPTGLMRTERQYENFILHVEWMHTEPGGNSGMFLWASPTPNPKSPFPDGVEVQMLELEWPELHKRNGQTPPVAYVHGEVWGVGNLKTTPDNPRGNRSMSVENRCKGRGEWNTYDIVAVDGVIKLAVNGKFVNGISQATQKKGYICLESEGAKIYFRNLRILELPPGVTTPEQSAPLAQ